MVDTCPSVLALDKESIFINNSNLYLHKHTQSWGLGAMHIALPFQDICENVTPSHAQPPHPSISWVIKSQKLMHDPG